MTSAQRPRLLVVGTGLIGTSIGLAASRAGYDVQLHDRDPGEVELASSLGAGRPWVVDSADRADGGDAPAGAEVDLAVVATPPGTVAEMVLRLIDRSVARTVSHVCSVQHDVQRQVEAVHRVCESFIGSHPIAGRELSGARHATAELFEGRPWLVCPTATSGDSSVARVEALARACGAVTSRLPAEDHDALLAGLSHAPQLVASALAATLGPLTPAQVALSGAGLRDTSRLADSDPELWAGIVAANPGPIAAALRALLRPLVELLPVLDAADAADAADHAAVAAAVHTLLSDGRSGRARLTGKHGQRPTVWAAVSVVVPDAPGELAQLLADAAQAQVNVEDIHVDHAPGQPLGVVELSVDPVGRGQLAQGLRAAGWHVLSGSSRPS